MSEPEGPQNESFRFRLSRAIRDADGRAFWWRATLTEIEEGLALGNTSHARAASDLNEIIEVAASSQLFADSFPDPNIREALKEYYEGAITETFEFAERNGLPSLNRISPTKPPENRGR
jgi:ribosomal protein S12 methylthiotransferase accessory factor YcaO